VEMAMEFYPDLIICDIMMPVLDGYGVLHAVQKNKLIKNTPFIFLTAKTERSDLRKGMELGADDFVTKPFSGTELLNAVDSRLNKIGLLKEELSIDLEGLQNLLKVSEDKNALNSLTEDRNTNIYKKKQVIYTQGNHPNRLYFVLKGKVKTFKRNEDGKELVTDLFSPGDFLGYIALMEESVYKDTAEALEESELAIIPKEEFEELIKNNKEVSRNFISLLAKNISNKENQLLGLAYNSLRKKVAEALVLLQKKYQLAAEDNFVIEISRESLATIAGTATESLIRTLSDFRNEKMIEIKDGTIVIVNQKKLQQLLN
jgi:CRP-like cAMP-binding protein